MYDKTYVAKAKKKRTITIITVVAAILVVALCIVAFLSNYVGNFTISIVDYQSRMALSNMPNSGYNPSGQTSASDSLVGENEDFTTYSTAPSFTNASPCNNNEVAYRQSNFDVDVTIDSEGKATNYHPIVANYAGTDATLFYAYTFYVTNVGKSAFYYGYGINVTTFSANTTVLDCLRIRVYQNVYSYDGTQTHDYKDYTKSNANYSTTGMTSAQKRLAAEYVAECDAAVTAGTMSYFLDGSNVVDSATTDKIPTVIAQGEVIRYTIIMWLAGDDPNCTGDFGDTTYAPLRLSAYVAAYDNTEETTSSASSVAA